MAAGKRGKSCAQRRQDLGLKKKMVQAHDIVESPACTETNDVFGFASFIALGYTEVG